MKHRNTVKILMLILCTCLLSCKTTDSEETGTTFPESFQKVWEDDDTSFIVRGYFFSEEKWYGWNFSTFNPGTENCYDYFYIGTLIDYEGDIFNVEIEDAFGEKSISSFSFYIENNTLSVPSRGSIDLYLDGGITLDQHTPRCDSMNNGLEKK